MGITFICILCAVCKFQLVQMYMTCILCAVCRFQSVQNNSAAAAPERKNFPVSAKQRFIIFQQTVILRIISENLTKPKSVIILYNTNTHQLYKLSITEDNLTKPILIMISLIYKLNHWTRIPRLIQNALDTKIYHLY